jgi:regulator of sirC expression with transglutaminase-like and TPR domain
LKPKIDPEQITAELSRTNLGTATRERGTLASAKKSRLAALASLLADDSPSVLAKVRRALEFSGRESNPALERAAASDDARLRARARGILMQRTRRAARRHFVRYATRTDLDLERALLLLARIHAPGLDPRPYSRALDAMAAEVAKRAAVRRSTRATHGTHGTNATHATSESGDLERALVLSEYLGKELAFGGSRGEFHHPDNIHLHRAIERRAGVPLTLSAIWVFVARRAGIRAAFVPLPGHVMVRLYGGSRSAIVDPYHQGRKRTEAECKTYLEKHGITVNPGSFREVPDAVLLRRQIGNLARSAEIRRLPAEARSMTALLRALEPRRKRGALPG